MKLRLEERPQNIRLIVGFPGFGLVGSISTKYMIEHLDVRKIGSVESAKLLPLAAVHKGNLIGPLDVFYDKKNNLVILQVLSDLAGMEWEVADIVEELVNDLKAKEIIILEGIPGKTKKSNNAFYYCNGKDAFEKFKLRPLEEGIMTGVTATLLLKSNHININCVFVESSTGMPDSQAAAKSIEVMNQHLGLDVDCKPLLSAAKKFEGMLKTAIANKQPQQALPKYKTEKNDLDYLG